MKIHKKGLTIVEMAIVLLLFSIVFSIIFSLIQNFSIFKTTQEESEILKDIYLFAKRSAIKSGQIIYMDIDLNENKYKIYRKKRSEVVENETLIERNLSMNNQIVYLKTHSNKIIDNGIITVLFYPQGFNDEIYFFLGSKNNIKKTVIYPRYGQFAIIKNKKYQIEEVDEKIIQEDKGENF